MCPTMMSHLHPIQEQISWSLNQQIGSAKYKLQYMYFTESFRHTHVIFRLPGNTWSSVVVKLE
jgi:hypothetical protein